MARDLYVWEDTCRSDLLHSAKPEVRARVCVRECLWDIKVVRNTCIACVLSGALVYSYEPNTNQHGISIDSLARAKIPPRLDFKPQQLVKLAWPGLKDNYGAFANHIFSLFATLYTDVCFNCSCCCWFVSTTVVSVCCWFETIYLCHQEPGKRVLTNCRVLSCVGTILHLPARMVYAAFSLTTSSDMRERCLKGPISMKIDP